VELNSGECRYPVRQLSCADGARQGCRFEPAYAEAAREDEQAQSSNL